MKKFMHQFIGTVTELRSLLKISASTAVDENIGQIVCSTAKEWFEQSEAKTNVWIQFSTDEQSSLLVN